MVLAKACCRTRLGKLADSPKPDLFYFSFANCLDLQIVHEGSTHAEEAKSKFIIRNAKPYILEKRS